MGIAIYTSMDGVNNIKESDTMKEYIFTTRVIKSRDGFATIKVKSSNYTHALDCAEIIAGHGREVIACISK